VCEALDRLTVEDVQFERFRDAVVETVVVAAGVHALSGVARRSGIETDAFFRGQDDGVDVKIPPDERFEGLRCDRFACRPRGEIEYAVDVVFAEGAHRGIDRRYRLADTGGSLNEHPAAVPGLTVHLRGHPSLTRPERWVRKLESRRGGIPSFEMCDGFFRPYTVAVHQIGAERFRFGGADSPDEFAGLLVGKTVIDQAEFEVFNAVFGGIHRRITGDLPPVDGITVPIDVGQPFAGSFDFFDDRDAVMLENTVDAPRQFYDETAGLEPLPDRNLRPVSLRSTLLNPLMHTNGVDRIRPPDSKRGQIPPAEDEFDELPDGKRNRFVLK